MIEMIRDVCIYMYMIVYAYRPYIVCFSPATVVLRFF